MLSWSGHDEILLKYDLPEKALDEEDKYVRALPVIVIYCTYIFSDIDDVRVVYSYNF